MVKKIEAFLKKGDRIIDVGSGTCNVCEILQENNYKVIPIDIQDLSFVDKIKPIVYDGRKIPFGDEEFDVSIVLSVLHHVSAPESILNEAMRVSKIVIITEDTYKSKLHKYLTWFFDSLLNLEFIGHPHTNQTDEKWKKTFDRLNLELVTASHHRSLLVFMHSTYCLRKKTEPDAIPKEKYYYERIKS